MKEFFFLIFSFFLVLSSCQFDLGSNSSALSSNVTIRIAPYGEGDEVRSSRPIIHLKSVTGTGICRRYPFTTRQAQERLVNLGLKKEFIDEFFKVEDGEVETGGQDDPVKINVEGNWLKFGLWIGNDNKFSLIIDSMTYVASAVYKNQPFTHTGAIEASYCDDAPFLYFIPPRKYIAYNPFSKSPLDNLTIFISGFPIFDRSNQPSHKQQQRIQNVNQQFGIQGFGQEVGSVNQQGRGGQQQNQAYGPNEIIVIPDYTVELILRGHFITISGDIIASFVKRIEFPTQSSL